MKDELENKLAEKYSFMRARNSFSGELVYDENGKTYSIYCECRDGWYDLIDNLCQELTDLYNKNNVPLDNIHVHQIKEKYGELKFYTGSMIQGAFDIIVKYERLSTKTCEVCGDKGKLRTYGWWETLCDKHMKLKH